MKVLVKELTFINGAVVEAGKIVDYDLPKGTTISANLEPYKPKRGDSGQAADDGDDASAA